MHPIRIDLNEPKIAYPFSINSLTNLFKNQFSPNLQVTFKATFIAITAGLTTYGILHLFHKGKATSVRLEAPPDPCTHLWLEQLPPFKKEN